MYRSLAAKLWVWPGLWIVLIATMLLWGHSGWEARNALHAGHLARAAGDETTARIRYSEALMWRCPLCPWADEARAALAQLGVRDAAAGAISNTIPSAAAGAQSGTAARPTPSRPRAWAALVAGLALVHTMASAAAWAYTGNRRPWAAVTVAAAAITVLALGAA